MSEQQRLIPIITFSGANSVIIPDLGALIAAAEARAKAAPVAEEAQPKPAAATAPRTVFLGRVGGLAAGWFR